MTAFYDNKPLVLEAVGDGGWYYRWNIKEVQSESEDVSRTQWECEQVIVYAPLTSNKIVKAVIAEGLNPYEKKVLGITAMTALLGKKRFKEILGNLIYKPPGKPVLVPESDPRPVWNNANDDFKEEKQ